MYLVKGVKNDSGQFSKVWVQMVEKVVVVVKSVVNVTHKTKITDQLRIVPLIVKNRIACFERVTSKFRFLVKRISIRQRGESKGYRARF